MILLVGGTEDLGGRVVSLPRGQGHQLRCLARAETQESALGQFGAAVVRGDLTEPRTLPPAYQAQTPLLQVSLQGDAGLRVLATPPSVRHDAFQETHQLDEVIELARNLAVADADGGGTHPTDEFAPAGRIAKVR